MQSFSQPPCSRLWCSTAGGEENGCRTQHMPWADGTPCGPGHWCVKSACVRRSPAHAQSRARVDGQWGDWRKWSACSRSCGGGIRSRARECDGPAPANGGLYCKGDRVQYESCSTQDCPAGSRDFRLEQCEEYNGKNFDIEGVPRDVRWVPKYTSSKS